MFNFLNKTWLLLPCCLILISCSLNSRLALDDINKPLNDLRGNSVTELTISGNASHIDSMTLVTYIREKDRIYESRHDLISDSKHKKLTVVDELPSVLDEEILHNAVGVTANMVKQLKNEFRSKRFRKFYSITVVSGDGVPITRIFFSNKKQAVGNISYFHDTETFEFSGHIPKS